MYRFLLPAAALLFFPACDSGEPGDVNPEELITEVTLTLTPVGGGDALTITAADADGDGRDIVYTPSSLTLEGGTVYDGTITLRDGINDEDITEEIREEAEEHLFRYAFAPGDLGSVALTDVESDYENGNATGDDLAVGLRFRATVAADAAGSGDLVATLYHFDDAPKPSSSATSDEIDVDLEVPVMIAPPTL